MWLFTHLIWECLTLLWVTYQISKRNRLILFWQRNHPKCLTPANLRGQRSDFETSFLMALHLSLLISPSPIVCCYPTLLYISRGHSFIERGGSKLLIEMGLVAANLCWYRNETRDYSKALLLGLKPHYIIQGSYKDFAYLTKFKDPTRTLILGSS